jgi:AcrR family transcriptional regulator
VSPARERICEAMLSLVVAQGYEKTSAEEVIDAAGVSRAEFERCFAGKEECAVAVLDHWVGDHERAVRKAYDAESEWTAAMRAGAYAAARWHSEHPREVRYGVVEMLWAGELAQVIREAAFQRFVELVDRGREGAPDPASIPPYTAEWVIGSITEMITKHAQRGEFDSYQFVPELMYLAVLPYRGEVAARRELAIAPPPRAESP